MFDKSLQFRDDAGRVHSYDANDFASAERDLEKLTSAGHQISFENDTARRLQEYEDQKHQSRSWW